MLSEIILFQILYRHLISILLTYESKNNEIYPLWPCFINRPKFLKISLFETFSIAIGHLVFVTLVHFMYINI
jgi:hypothetical protein